ncbi:MAG: 50S ribosomal protein L21e [Nanoarchaeota archaeon]|nr:50S ribosomal protein L21e [Nanoarchaeota archaeon]
MKHIGCSRRKSRYKFKKNVRERGKISVTKFFQPFNPGDAVLLSVEPSVHSGLYHARFVGQRGIVKQKIGRMYEVAIKDKNKGKLLLVHPVHLKRVLK